MSKPLSKVYMENSFANRRSNTCQKRKAKTRMDSWGGSGKSSGFAQRPQWLSTYPRKKKSKKNECQIIKKNDGGWVGIKSEWEQTGFDVARNLQFCLKLGMKLKKVHRTLEFDQECWMEPYIRMNTEFRKQATNDFEKNFYKLMDNSASLCLGKRWRTCRSLWTSK